MMKSAGCPVRVPADFSSLVQSAINRREDTRQPNEYFSLNGKEIAGSFIFGASGF